MKNVKIYCLYDPETCKIRYLGRTTKKNIKSRLIEHITKSKYWKIYYPNSKPSHKINWINSLLNKGLKPKIKLLTTISGWEESHIFEQNLINKYKIKFNLTNSQDRGDGGLNNNISKETKQKISNNLIEGYYSGRINKTVKKVYFFDKNANFLFSKESLTNASEFLNIDLKQLSKKIIKNNSCRNYFLSYNNELNIEKYKYCYNIKEKQHYLFSTNKEIMSFLKIKRGIFEKYQREKLDYKGFGINCTNPKKLYMFDLIEDDIVYSFSSYKEASKIIGCSSSSIYKVTSKTRKSIKKFKLNKIHGK